MKKYLIKKGNHYATISIFERVAAFSWKNLVYRFQFRFHSDCYWSPARNQDDQDLNKITGIGFGINHHENSVRLAWVPDFNVPGSIKIYGYTYNGKEDDPRQTSLYITSVTTGQTCNAEIASLGDKYKITINGVIVSMDNSKPDHNLCFRLFPYFGGNNVAPQDMNIEIEYL
ncbi:MAG: hypothetical protein WCR72_11755 [Bacteroidota bacterium]